MPANWTEANTSTDFTALSGAGADWGFTPAPAAAPAPVLVLKTDKVWTKKAFIKITKGNVSYYVAAEKTERRKMAWLLVDADNWA